MSKTFRNDKSVDRDKLSFRDSLGSLSKQIKNTLKLAADKNDSEKNNPDFKVA